MAKITFNTFYARVSQALDIKSQLELASKLGLNRSAISQAKKKKEVPDRWVLNLYRLYGLNPDWVETGKGQCHKPPRKDAAAPPKPQRLEKRVLFEMRPFIAVLLPALFKFPQRSNHFEIPLPSGYISRLINSGTLNHARACFCCSSRLPTY